MAEAVTRGRATPPPDFDGAVSAAFGFVEARGFRRENDGDESCVTYESPNGVFVRISYDWRDRYLGCEVGQAGHEQDAMTIEELLTVEGAPRARGVFVAPDGNFLEAAKVLADLLSQFGGRALVCDPAVFEEVLGVRRRNTDRYS